MNRPAGAGDPAVLGLGGPGGSSQGSAEGCSLPVRPDSSCANSFCRIHLGIHHFICPAQFALAPPQLQALQPLQPMPSSFGFPGLLPQTRSSVHFSPGGPVIIQHKRRWRRGFRSARSVVDFYRPWANGLWFLSSFKFYFLRINLVYLKGRMIKRERRGEKNLLSAC